MYVSPIRRKWHRWRKVAEANGISYEQFKMRVDRGWLTERAATEPIQKKNAEYVLYHGEDVVDIGTIKELAERRGVQERTIRCYANPSFQNRGTKRPRKHFTLVRAE